MKLSYHHSQILARLRDGAEAQIRGILRGNLDDTPPGQGQVSSLMEFIRPILDGVLREARDWGYSKRDAELARSRAMANQRRAAGIQGQEHISNGRKGNAL